MAYGRAWFAWGALALGSIALGACGGARDAPAEEESAAATGGENEQPEAEATAAVDDGSCVDPEGGAFYLYLGTEAMVLTRPDDTRETLAVDDEALEDVTRTTAREGILDRAPDATVHVVTQAETVDASRDLVLRVLHDEGLSTADACEPSATSPFPSAEDALYSGR